MSKLRRHMMMQQGGGREYIQDGLSLWLDADYMCTAEKWIDKISGVEFIGHGVSIQSGLPYFDGSAYYSSVTANNNLYTNSTIEILFAITGAAMYHTIYFEGSDKCLTATYSHYNTENVMLCGVGQYEDRPRWGVGSLPINAFHTLSSAYSIGYLNGQRSALQSSSTTFWYNSAGCRIGCHVSGQYGFIGKLVCLRIYNRLLTSEEIRYNQEIDIARSARLS